jgi:hypothetical protein
MLEERLKQDVEAFYTIGPRNIHHYDNLCKAEDLIIKTFSSTFSPILLHEYEAEGKKFHNIIAEFGGYGSSNEVLIVGAHYDTEKSSSYSENATALAVLMELARYFSDQKTPRTLRIVAFTNEEKSFNHTREMGSLVYAKYCRSMNENVIGMITLETLSGLKDNIHGGQAREDNNPEMLDYDWLKEICVAIQATLSEVLWRH